MKAIVLAISAMFVLSACNPNSSSSGGGGGGQVNTKEMKDLSGRWDSSCMTDDQGNHFTEQLTLNENGTGSVVATFFNSNTCSGNPTKTEAPAKFTYTLITVQE
jgi:hypothetical protein